MTTMTRHRLFALLLFLPLAGCLREVPSTELRLSEMRFNARALAVSGNRTEVKVTLVRSGVYSRRPVELTGGDRLVAEVDGRPYELTQPEELTGTGRYQTAAPAGGAETPVRLLFVRKDGATTVVGSGALPLPFELADLPRSPSGSQPLEVRWFPVGPDPMELVTDGPCVSKTTEWMTEDTGSFGLQPGTLYPEVFRADGCMVDLTVARARDGSMDRGIGPGSFLQVRQMRTVRLTPVR